MLFTRKARTEEFEAAALPHLQDLYRTATRLLSDATKAEDVVQETYLQAWKSFDRFEPGTNCRAWLFQILVHTVHHYRRKWLNLRVVNESEDYLAEAAASTPPVPESISQEEILAALAKIPEEFRAVILLADVEEFSYKETAGLLGIPIGTVMSRVSRGRKILREQLSDLARSYGIGGRKEGQGA